MIESVTTPVGDTAIMWVVITMLFKFIERIVGKVMFEKNASKRDEENSERIQEIHTTVKSMKEIMGELKSYARQNTENAIKMSTLLEYIDRRD